MSDTITIKNCKIVNEGEILEKDILIKNGRFEEINEDVQSQGEVFAASGFFLSQKKNFNPQRLLILILINLGI